ncbi:MAG: beta-propeller domain-containing protein, partial [Candidatus Aenigmarchaeota archaeon]|nr:beta-propeller domain-containing protein [Candidatus Aenigmarchaeota archaeon]
KLQRIGEAVQNYVRSIGPTEGSALMKKIEGDATKVMADFQKENEKTVIHKISVSGNRIEYKATGAVPGRVLNQFSMDEHEGNFRIATTTSSGQSLNHVYVMDQDLKVVGKIEDLAMTERIYSARFMGDKAYLVTFHRTDPLFVIDLSDSAKPRVAGELKIPGFSEYLHPFDETHLIGLGREADENGRQTGQIKLSIFDVTDISNPKEMHKYLIGDNYAYSEALNDHKAFLFSKGKNLLAIPVSASSMENGKHVEGAYVFGITLENGFDLKGVIDHNLNKEEKYISPVKRSLYIEDVLYTISDRMVKANKLGDLSQILEIILSASDYEVPVYQRI